MMKMQVLNIIDKLEFFKLNFSPLSYILFYNIN